MISWYRTILGQVSPDTSCNIDLIFTPKFFGLPNTPLTHSSCIADGSPNNRLLESESESEMFLFDPYKKYIQSNNETILDQGTPIKISLVANIRAAYYIIKKNCFHITS